MNVTDVAYIAGLIDADGCITYKQYMRKRSNNKKAYPTWSVRIEINMTDKPVIQWIHETLEVGTFGKKPPGKGQLGRKMQYRWRCGFRDALYVAKLLSPYAIVKLHKLEQIIDHYDDNVVDLKTERQARRIWT